MKRRKRKKLASAVLTGALAAAMTATAVPAQVMAAAPEGFSEEQKIQNDRFWEDVEGNTIYSQGGGIFEFDGTYYWYGVKYKNAPNYVDDPTNSQSSRRVTSQTLWYSTPSYESMPKLTLQNSARFLGQEAMYELK